MKKGQKAPASKKPVGVGKAPSSQGTPGTGESKPKKREVESTPYYLMFRTAAKKIVKNARPQNPLQAATITMNVVSQLIPHFIDLIAAKALDLVEYTNRETIGYKEIQRAVDLLFPGEFASFIKSEFEGRIEKQQKKSENK
ncbi:Histone superfamily protein [Tubulinosema ratisbonensis]|uniref:Histone superfamily protein n=1 Tax=Tubulinosema ratisbonensis TaxID=291195 RepID=A0A437AP66_9MICR|nr:Histone superfamily protein [Tubulinosema ratisbonensis]